MLWERRGEYVSHYKLTVIIGPNGAEIIAAPPEQDLPPMREKTRPEQESPALSPAEVEGLMARERGTEGAAEAASEMSDVDGVPKKRKMAGPLSPGQESLGEGVVAGVDGGAREIELGGAGISGVGEEEDMGRLDEVLQMLAVGGEATMQEILAPTRQVVRAARQHVLVACTHAVQRVFALCIDPRLEGVCPLYSVMAPFDGGKAISDD